MKKLCALLFCIFVAIGVEAGTVPVMPQTNLGILNIIFPEVTASSGTHSCYLAIDPGSALNAGTTYYYFIPGKTFEIANGSDTYHLGSYIHCVWTVHYWEDNISTNTFQGKIDW